MDVVEAHRPFNVVLNRALYHIRRILLPCLTLMSFPVQVGGAVDPRCLASMRTMALGVILTRAGLSLDAAAMWRLRGPVVRLALLSASAEVLTVSLISHSLLGLPWVGISKYCPHVAATFIYCNCKSGVMMPDTPSNALLYGSCDEASHTCQALAVGLRPHAWLPIILYIPVGGHPRGAAAARAGLRGARGGGHAGHGGGHHRLCLQHQRLLHRVEPRHRRRRLGGGGVEGRPWQILPATSSTTLWTIIY